MARTCGIRIGRTEFELLVLDGSVKKPSVSLCLRGEIPADSEDPLDALTSALKEATKGLKLPTDEVGLVVDAGSAAFRSLTLPFDDPAKIEQVIKFEIESQLPQWNIDDVIIDFHTVNSTGVESHLLVTAVPIEPLGDLIEAATKAGLEPFEAEVETSAMVNAAWSAGVLTVDGSQVLINVTGDTAAMAVVDGGSVRSMRAARLTGTGDAARSRLMREIMRTVTGMQASTPLDGIYISGLSIPGIIGEEVEDVVIQTLTPFEGGDLPEGMTASNFAVVFGAALGRMGGGIIKPHLRREDLAFSGKLERLELPMAVLALLIAAVMGIHYVVLQKEIAPLEQDLHKWLDSSNRFMLGVPKEGQPGYIAKPSDSLRLQAERLLADTSPESDDYLALRQIELSLNKEIKILKKNLGQDSDIRQPQSAFGAMTRVLNVLDELGEDIGYFAIKEVSSIFRQARSQTPDMVEVSMNMVFFAENDVVASRNWKRYFDEVESKPWCVEIIGPGTDSLDGNVGISVSGIKVLVDMAVLDEMGEAK
ncbi:MAG: Tfp pilus assembly PilM family ATPase [Planctomycetota bacterium]|jgi:Tfp pilus assembly PilM family ATPase